MNNELIDKAVKDFSRRIKELYGEKLKEILLFGSCARGDYSDESDVDIMILLDMGVENLYLERKKIRKIESDVDEEFGYEILFSTIIQSYQEFNYWKDVQPFYKKVIEEGIRYA